MVDRVLRGARGSGVGFFISRPGYDVKTASLMQLAFSSYALTMRLVAKGSLSIAPIYGDLDGGHVGAPKQGYGATQAVSAVSYGETISPPPLVIAVAASQWRLPLSNNTNQLPYLNGVYCTYFSETINSGVYDTLYGVEVFKNSPGAGGSGLHETWHSARFIAQVGTSSVTFYVNSPNTVTVKYLILKW